MAQLKVLVVDDDENVCECLQEILEPDGCEVVTVSDPETAMATLKADSFHVITLDLMMPKLRGIPLLDKIRKIDRDVAVVILTGYPSLESATDAIDLDVSAYMQKPFSADELRQTIARVARKKGIVVRREDEFHITVGRNIRAVRKKKNLTLKETGRRSGLSVSLLSQLERAESSASVSSLFKIATALNVRITELLGEF